MSSISEIYFNYNTAIRQANQLDNIAGKLDHAATNDMENILGAVNKVWKSDSAPQYISKGEKVECDIRVTAASIRKIASAIRTIAERVKQAELEAWEIANARNS